MHQIDEVVRAVAAACGRKTMGVYLHGSATHGGLRTASDLDVLVVVDESLDLAERDALVTALMAVSGGTADRRSVELTVVVHGQIRPWRYPPQVDLVYGDWLRQEISSEGPPTPRSMPDLAVQLAQVLATGRTLSGPDPRLLLDAVPPADTVRACLDGIAGLLADVEDDTRNVLLTLARIWVTVETGSVLSKDAAADWAVARLPPQHRAVLQHARGLYLTTTYRDEQPWPEGLRARVAPHVSAVLDEIAGAAARRS